MNSVIAKFVVQSRTKTMGTDTEGKPAPCYYVEMRPVSSGSDENKKFFRYTPGGEIKMGILNLEAGKFFEPGEEVFITFHKSDKATGQKID